MRMLEISVLATIGCVIGFILAFALAGPTAFIPFLAALLVYNLAKRPKKKIVK